MNSVLSHPRTLYDELCQLPEGTTGEILNGTLHTQLRPSGRHGLAARALNIDLAGPFDLGRGGPGGWWIIPEPEVHFVKDSEVVVPDTAVRRFKVWRIRIAIRR